MSQQLNDEHHLLDEEQRNRLWEHGMHAENVFYNQLNFLFVFESVLFGAIITLLASARASEKLVLVIIGFGLLLTCIWGYIWFRQGYVFDKIKERLLVELPEYRETIHLRKLDAQFPFLNLRKEAYSITVLMVLGWFALAILTLTH